MSLLLPLLWKKLYRYGKGRMWQHSEDLWPYVRIVREHNQIVQCKYAGNCYDFRPLSTLENFLHGKSLNIIATGPSLATHRPAIFQQGINMGVNGAFKAAIVDKFDFIVCIDKIFVREHAVALSALSVQGVRLLLTPFCWFELLKQQCVFNIENITLFEQVNDFLFQAKCTDTVMQNNLRSAPHVWLDENTVGCGFSLNAEIGFFDGKTVAYTALQLAAYMGGAEIDFYGMDLGGPRFYDDSSSIVAPSYLDRDFEAWILPSFRFARSIVSARNITCTNNSVKSRLPSDVMAKK